MTTPAFEALLSVQDLDTALDRHRRRRATLQERADIAALDTRLAPVRDRLAAATARRDEVAGREETLGRDLAATKARIAEVNKRLYGGTVSATRDLQAMAKDVESLTARASGLEQQVLAVMEEWEPLDAEVTAIEWDRDSLMGSRAAVEERLAAAEREIDADIAATENQRVEAAAHVDPDLLVAYETLRTRLGGVGVARLTGGRCSGCHLTLPATELDRLRREPPDALILCDQCGRILVRP